MGAAAHTTEGVLGGLVPLTTSGVLPPLHLLEHVAAPQQLELMLELLDDLRPKLERARALLVAGAHTARDVQQLQADLGIGQADIRVVLQQLNSWRPVEDLVYEDAAELIGLWRWERRVRSDLLDLLRAAQLLHDQARALAPGAAEITYVTRSTDTWQSVAAQQLGDWTRWPELVELNAGDPATLDSGTVLRIPRR